MPNQNPLMQVPGLAGYLARRQMLQGEEQGELQSAQAATGLMAALEKRKREQQSRSELEALGAEPTQEALATWAARHSGPEAVMRAQQGSLDRKASADAAREATIARNEAIKQAAADRRDALKANIDLRYDALAQQAANEDQKRSLEQRRITDKAEADRRHDETLRLIAGNREPAAPVAVIGPDGKPVLVPRAEAIGRTPAATEKPLNEFQGKSTLYGTRAAQSDKILKSLEEKISTVGLAVKQSAAGTPIVGGLLGAAGNVMLSSEQQRVEQAQRDFVNAILRQESGAVISDAEFENAKKQYFPAPGDSKVTIEQKRANRKLAIKGFARMAGAGGADIEALANEPLLPGAPPATPAPAPAAPGGWSIRPM